VIKFVILPSMYFKQHALKVISLFLYL